MLNYYLISKYDFHQVQIGTRPQQIQALDEFL